MADTLLGLQTQKSLKASYCFQGAPSQAVTGSV